MKGSTNLNPEEISQLSPEIFSNLNCLLGNFESKDLEVRLAVINKISDDFLPSRFLPKYYPINAVTGSFCQALNSDSAEEVIDALSGLTEIDADLARKNSRKLLKHSDLSVKEEAVICLGFVGQRVDIELLLDLLSNEDNDVLRAGAYSSLLRLGEVSLFSNVESIVDSINDEALLSMLESFYSLVDRFDFIKLYSKLQVRVLSSNRPDLVAELDDLRQVLDNKSSLSELDGLDVTKKSDSNRIFFYFEHSSSDVRFSALSLFGAGAKPNKNIMPRTKPSDFVIDKLKELIDDPSEEVRSEVVSILGDWKDTGSISFISDCLSERSELVRLDALYALGEIGGKDAYNELMRFNYENGSDLEKTRFLQARIRLGDESYFKEWLSNLSHNNAMVRANVAGGIWTVWNKKWNSLIEKSLYEALNIEQFSYVYNELNDAVAFLKSRN